MSIITGEDGFIFTWSIQNFSMCAQNVGECVKSPTFAFQMFPQSEWSLALYPRGKDRYGRVSCFLQQGGNDLNDLIFDYCVTLCATEISWQISLTSSVVMLKTDHFHGELIRRTDIFENSNIFLPNDILTLKCSMWSEGKDPAMKKEIVSQIYPVDANISNPSLWEEMFRSVTTSQMQTFKRRFCPNDCYARTTIKVNMRYVTWRIERFSTLELNERISIPAVAALKDDPPLFVTLYLTEDSEADGGGIKIEIRRNDGDCEKQVYVKCKVSILISQTKIRYSLERAHIFHPKIKSEVFHFSLGIAGSKLIEDTTNPYLIDDVLSLQFKFAISKLGEEYHVCGENFINSGYPGVVPTNKDFKDQPFSFRHLYKDRKFCDVTLRAGGKEFHVHKNIVCARSPVFLAMFENDTYEKKTGVVDIQDVSPATLERLLDYIYCAQLDPMRHEDARKLYSVADKYQVLSLKEECMHKVVSGLSVSNVCNVLVLADMHQDFDMMMAVEEFLLKQGNRIFESSEWKNLADFNVKLAEQTLRKILIKKWNF